MSSVFPHEELVKRVNANALDNVIIAPCEAGLTKREYFAAMAMNGMMSNGKGGNVAKAVQLADDLIAELAK